MTDEELALVNRVLAPPPIVVGGSFAPPLSDEKIAAYKALIDSLPSSPIKDGMTAMMNCCGVWWELPDPLEGETWKHPSGKGTVIPLMAEHAQDLDEHIPWAHEIQAVQELFETIDPVNQRDLRNAAFHLLWHVRELDKGREPLTNDKL